MATNKTCKIIARCTVRKTGRVFIIVENGGGKRYIVNIQPDGRMTCLQEHGEDCPSRMGGHTCYHIANAQAYEAKRAERLAQKAQAQASAPVAEVTSVASEKPATASTPVVATKTTQPVVSKAVQLPHKVGVLVGKRTAGQRREYAALNGNAGFSLMRR